MADWSSGYVDSVDYTYGFYRELAPSFLSYNMALARSRAPTTTGAPINYCELGCGQGLSANILAATNPEIQFYATDFNPQHIVGARRLAAAAGLGNIQFYDHAFAEFGAEPSLPAQFDYISLHGIYSWVSQVNRVHLVEFIRRRLRPGGIVYISYNALPGWAPVMPLRRLLVDHADTATGPLAPRIDAAIDFAKRFIATNPNYLRSNPTVADRLERLAAMPRKYLAHEYFNRDWTPFYFADVASELSEAKLTFVGSASPADYVDILNFSPEQGALLRSIANPLRQESLRDYLVNQQFRRDIFVRGATALSNTQLRDTLIDTRFALISTRDLIPKSIKSPTGEAQLQGEFYDPVLDCLEEGPHTIREMFSKPIVSAVGSDRLMQVITVLVASNALQPGLPAKDDQKRAKSARALNAALMKHAEESEDIAFLASPVLGSGIAVNRIDQLFLSAHLAKRQDAVSWIWDILHRENRRLIREGQPLQEPEDNLAELRKMEAAFRDQKLPLLRQLGIA